MGARDTISMIKENRGIDPSTDEVLYTEERTTVKRNQSLYANITDFAKKTHDVTDETDLRIHTMETGLFIEFDSESADDSE